MISPNYYEILRIGPESDAKAIEDTINAGIKKNRVLVNNLDRNVWRKAEEELKLLLEARKVLLDPEKRAKYDLLIFPAREMEVIAKCQSKRKIFYLIFNQGTDKKWIFKRAYLPAVHDKSKEESRDGIEISNLDFTNFQCPVCNNAGMGKCGNCYKLACANPKSIKFHCPWCRALCVRSNERFNSVKGSRYEAR